MSSPHLAPSPGTPRAAGAAPAGAHSDSAVTLSQKELPPDAEYAAAVASAMRELAEIRRHITSLQAREAALLQQCDDAATRLAAAEAHPDHGEFAHRSVAAEIGFALRESDRAMVRKIARASTLVTHYPAVHIALAKGEVSQAHVSVIIDAGSVLGIAGEEADGKRAIYEAQVLEIAKTETAGRLRALAKGRAEALACLPIEERHAEAVRGRKVLLVEQEDGVVDLVATVSAVYGKGIMDRLDQIGWAVKNASSGAEAAHKRADHEAGAGGAAAGAGFVPDRRSLDEIRADAFVEMLLGADASSIATVHGKGLAAIQARIQVIVPEERVTSQASGASSVGGDSDTGHSGSSDHIANELVGYGPIDTGTARKIAGLTSSWERIMVSTLTGHVLRVESYRPSSAMKRFLAARDLRCRAPGCNVMVNRSDIDHTIDAALGGATSTDNLATVCRYHHTMKHHRGWKLRQQPGGVMEWETPLGKKHRDRPGSNVRYRRVAPEESDERLPSADTAAQPF